MLGNGSLLEHGLRLDLKELKLDELVVLGEVSEGREITSGLLFAAVVDEPTRRERHEGHTTQENQAGGDLETDGHEPSGIRLLAALGATNVVGTAERWGQSTGLGNEGEMCVTH